MTNAYLNRDKWYQSQLSDVMRVKGIVVSSTCLELDYISDYEKF